MPRTACEWCAQRFICRAILIGVKTCTAFVVS
jgi:hypothetical protein